jgi:DNA-directed RNA polymerase specialized sigma24 family protein
LQMPLGTVKTHARRGLLQVREILGLENKGEGQA